MGKTEAENLVLKSKLSIVLGTIANAIFIIKIEKQMK